MNRRDRKLHAQQRRAELQQKWGQMMVRDFQEGKDGLHRVIRDRDLLARKNPQQASEIRRAYDELPPLHYFLGKLSKPELVSV